MNREPKPTPETAGLVFEQLKSTFTNEHILFQRAKVPGGWLVAATMMEVGEGYVPRCLSFYPDPKHEWDGKSSH